jgi:hypothetical protein
MRWLRTDVVGIRAGVDEEENSPVALKLFDKLIKSPNRLDVVRWRGDSPLCAAAVACLVGEAP